MIFIMTILGCDVYRFDELFSNEKNFTYGNNVLYFLLFVLVGKEYTLYEKIYSQKIERPVKSRFKNSEKEMSLSWYITSHL